MVRKPFRISASLRNEGEKVNTKGKSEPFVSERWITDLWNVKVGLALMRVRLACLLVLVGLLHEVRLYSGRMKVDRSTYPIRAVKNMTCASLCLLYDHMLHRPSFWINPTGFVFWGFSGVYFLLFFLKLLSLLFANGRIILSSVKKPLFPWSYLLHLLFDWHKVYSQTLMSGISSTRF